MNKINTRCESSGYSLLHFKTAPVQTGAVFYLLKFTCIIHDCRQCT